MADSMYLVVAIPYGFVSFGITTIAAFWVRQNKGTTMGQWWSSVVFSGTESFRNHINEAARKYGNWTLHWVWDVLVKYVDPAILAGLFVNGLFNEATNTKSDFSNYPGWVQAVGIMFVAIMFIIFVSLAVFPSWWTSLFGDEMAPAKVAKESAAKSRGSQEEQVEAVKESFTADSMLQS